MLEEILNKKHIMKRLLPVLLFSALLLAECTSSDETGVGVKVTIITLNKSATTIAPGGSEQLSVSEVLPTDAADKSVAWSSDNTARATVDATGKVTIPAAATVGMVNITATAKDGSGVKATCAVTVGTIKVTGIILNKTATTITVGGSEQLSVSEVLPTDATDKSVTWSSDNTTRATVDATGKVTVPATATTGTVNITATANDGSGVQTTCIVTVSPLPPVKVTRITLNETYTAIDNFDQIYLTEVFHQLYVTEVLPANATDNSVTWSSNNTARATVDATGKVTIPVTATSGTVHITATANDGSGVNATCIVGVPTIRATSITINKTSATIPMGGTEQLFVTEVLPANTIDKSVRWSSNNTARATVDNTGKITIPATATEGIVHIIVVANDGGGAFTACIVTIIPVKVTSITLNKNSTTISPMGGTEQLFVTEVLPVNATNNSVTWSSNNTALATVDATGKVTVPKTETGGTVTITATANDGSGVTASCTVTIPPPVKVTKITLNKTSTTISAGGTEQLYVVEVLPVNATDKSVTWSSKSSSSGYVVSAGVNNTGKVTAAIPMWNDYTADDTITITATANDGSGVTASCTVTATVRGEGVLINGVVWAATNTGLNGTFAFTPRNNGGYSAVCPSGWRLPTNEELSSLLESDKVSRQWLRITTLPPTFEGYMFTDRTSGNGIFLPAAGRLDSDNTPIYVNRDGYYRSSTSNYLIFYLNNAYISNSTINGISSRCVRQ